MDNLQKINNKIFREYNNADLARLLAYYNFKNEKIVFTNGCFDILHLGHVQYLAQSANLGTKLVVGLNTDNSVRILKGENRPYQNEIARSTILSSLFFVDLVVLFDEQTPYNLIKTIKPHILVKGADYKAEDIVGYDIVKEYGGEVVTIDLVEGHSTTNIINKFNNQ